MRSVVIALAVALCVVVTACGGNERRSNSERPLTSEQAATLADSLYRNWQDQGATFVANAAWTNLGRSITMRGEVDWVGGTGHAVVQSTGSEMGLTEVWWSATGVVEWWPSISGLLTNLGHPGNSVVSRSLDPERRLVDRVIAVVRSLAADQRENPLLIQQKPGSAFIREDDLQGRAVQVLRYGERNLYWLATDGGNMVRFDGNTATGVAPVVVDLVSKGPQTIVLPPAELTIPSQSIGALYQSLIGT